MGETLISDNGGISFSNPTFGAYAGEVRVGGYGVGGGSSSWVNRALEIINKVSTVIGSNASLINQAIKRTPDIGYIVAYSPKLMKVSKVVGFLGTPGDIVSILCASVYAGVNWDNSIIRGPDAWSYKSFSSAGLGVGWISASAMAVGYKYYYIGDINHLSMKTFEKWGNNISISADVGFAIGLNISWVENTDFPGEYLIGVGFGGGIGVGPTMFSGQYTRQFNYIHW